MSLKANIDTDVAGNITIKMRGGLDFENGLPLRQELESLCREFPESLIIIDLYNVDFVGSSGIKMFVETLEIINKQKQRIRLANVKSEFLKVFRLYTLDEAIIMWDEFDDTNTEITSINGKRTFQN